MLICLGVGGQSERGFPTPQGTAQQFQKNRDLYFFFKKKLNKSPALLIGKCYPCPHPPPTICFPGLHPHPTTAPGVFTTWNNRGLGGTAAGRRGTGQVPPRGAPQDNTTSTRKVANQAEMGTSFQGPYIQTPQDQQGRGCPDGIRHEPVGRWASPGAVLEEGLRSALTPIPTPPLVTTALQRAPCGGEFPLSIPRE